MRLSKLSILATKLNVFSNEEKVGVWVICQMSGALWSMAFYAGLSGAMIFIEITGWEHTGQMLCIVDTSLSVSMTLRVCLRELCCLFGIFHCLDLNHLVRVFYLFIFS